MSIDPISFPADDDAGGRDPVAADVDTAQANAQARYREYESDTFGQGSTIGDLIDVPPSPGGAYYDPPRDY